MVSSIMLLQSLMMGYCCWNIRKPFEKVTESGSPQLEVDALVLQICKSLQLSGGSVSLACFCEYRYFKIASKLKWSQTGNTRGGLGRSVPIDLHMEHLNHNVKFANLGASVAESTIVQMWEKS